MITFSSPVVRSRRDVRLVACRNRSDLGEGGLDRIVEVVTVERCEQPVVVDEVLQPVAHFDEGDVDALLIQLPIELFQYVGGGDIDVGDGLALQDDPPWGAFSYKRAHLLAEHAGVGEEQWRFPSVHENAGQFFDNAVGVSTVPTRRVVGEPEHFAVWPPAALEEQQDRQHHCDQDALQHSEEDDTTRGNGREDNELRRTFR